MANQNYWYEMARSYRGTLEGLELAHRCELRAFDLERFNYAHAHRGYVEHSLPASPWPWTLSYDEIGPAKKVTMTEERRARTIGEGPYWAPVTDWPTGTMTPGTIAWSEHEEIWRKYREKYGNDQDAERIAARGGFGYWEAAALLGYEPRTWRP